MLTNKTKKNGFKEDVNKGEYNTNNQEENSK